MKLTKEQIENVKSFLLETFAFNEEQLAAIDGLIPMTQEVFESILERCNELGSAADKIFYRLLRDYPDLTDVYGQKLEKELDEKYPDTELPEETPDRQRGNGCVLGLGRSLGRMRFKNIDNPEYPNHFFFMNH